LDHGQVYLVTDQLTRFVLVGESAGNCNKAVKTLRLAVFAPSPILHPQSLDYNVRVYTLEDSMAALEVTETELIYFRNVNHSIRFPKQSEHILGDKRIKYNNPSFTTMSQRALY
jgi:hypothetical protein